MISIIGSGKVGSAIAFLCTTNSTDDVILVNRTKSKAIGESLDLANTIPEGSQFSIFGTDDFSKIKKSDIIVITASTAIYQKSRTEMMSDQITMINDIKNKIVNYSPNSIVLIVSNPVDILTYVFQKNYANKEKVFGIASTLDSSRFRYLLSRELNLKQSEISNSLVLGEHGDSMVPIFSIAKAKGVPVLEILTSDQITRIESELRGYWKKLREYKSRSVFGIAKNSFDIITMVKSNQRKQIPVSTFVDGEYGVNDTCMGIPAIIGQNGVEKIIEIELSKNELSSLQNSAKIIKDYFKKL